MYSPQFAFQPSCDLDIYLPSELDIEDTLVYQSADKLTSSFNFDLTSSAHRMESDLFDPTVDDMEALSTLTNHKASPIDINNFDIINYFYEQSTVVPHVPNSLRESKMNANFPWSPLSTNSINMSPPNSPSYSNQLNIKRFLVFDETTGRERRPLLHEFIRLILENDEYSDIAEYTDRKHGIFRLNKPRDVAELWKHVKGRNSDNKMTYDKLARAIRYYYGSGIMYSSPGRFTFRFGPKSGFGTTWWPAY